MISDYHLFQEAFAGLLFAAITVLFIANFIKREDVRLSVSLSSVLLVSIFIGIRAKNIGTDTHHYVSILLNGDFIDDGFEPGFALIAYIVKAFSDDYQWFLIIISLIINFHLLFSFRKFTRNYPVVMAVFISTFVYEMMNISMIRQGMAMSLATYAVACLLNGEVRRYFVYLVFAVFTHFSAIVALPLFLLSRIKLNRKNLTVFLLLTLTLFNFSVGDLFYFVKDYPFFGKVYDYFNWKFHKEWHVKHIYYLVIVMLLIYFPRSSSLRFPYDGVLKIYLWGVFLISVLRTEEMVADRIFYYFLVIGVLLVVNLHSFIRQKIIFFGVMYVLTVLWLVKSVFIQFESWWIPPFKSVGLGG